VRRRAARWLSRPEMSPRPWLTVRAPCSRAALTAPRSRWPAERTGGASQPAPPSPARLSEPSASAGAGCARVASTTRARTVSDRAEAAAAAPSPADGRAHPASSTDAARPTAYCIEPNVLAYYNGWRVVPCVQAAQFAVRSTKLLRAWAYNGARLCISCVFFQKNIMRSVNSKFAPSDCTQNNYAI
jgi:hypothetical protein